MNTKMHVKSSERGVIRVFHIDLPCEAIERFTTQAGTGEWPLQYVLGAKALRNSFVEVIDLRDLGDMSLSDYLKQAHDVSGDAFDAMRSQLDGLKGHVLVLPSQAFDQTEQDLVIATPLRWLGTFNEPEPAGRGPAVKSASASRRDSGTDAPQRPTRKNAGPNAGVIIGILLLLAIAIIVAKFTVF